MLFKILLSYLGHLDELLLLNFKKRYVFNILYLKVAIFFIKLVFSRENRMQRIQNSINNSVSEK